MSWTRNLQPETLGHILKARNHTSQNKIAYNYQETLPKFQRAYSDSRISRVRRFGEDKSQPKENKSKMFTKIMGQLNEIKETLQQSASNGSFRRKKRPSKRKEKVITEISEPYHKNVKYLDVIRRINEIKTRPNSFNVANPQAQTTSIFTTTNKQAKDEKNLFYGVDFIDSIEFKIKIKLSQTSYLLFAKNNHTKIMLEMSYSDYMRLHLGELKGNPCNILRYLYIENHKIKLRLRKVSEQGFPKSLKTYLGYY